MKHVTVIMPPKEVQREKFICPKTNQPCEHDCISPHGGYAGDDCFIVHDRFSKESPVFWIIAGIIIAATVIILALR